MLKRYIQFSITFCATEIGQNSTEWLLEKMQPNDILTEKTYVFDKSE